MNPVVMCSSTEWVSDMGMAGSDWRNEQNEQTPDWRTFDVHFIQATEALVTSGLYGHFHPVCQAQFQALWLQSPDRASWLLNQAIDTTLISLKAGWQEHHEWRRLGYYLSHKLGNNPITPERLQIEFGTLYTYDSECRNLRQPLEVAQVETETETQERALHYQISTYYGAFLALFRAIQRTAFKSFLSTLNQMEGRIVLPHEAPENQSVSLMQLYR